MKKKKYGWLRRCFSLMCVLVLISMIVLQSVPVTYASSEPDAFTSEPEDNSQTISTAEIPTGDDTQPGNQLVDDIFSEENSETSPEIPTDDNSEMLSNSPVEGNQDETSENISGTQEGEISDVFQNPSSEPEQETSSGITDDQQDELTSGENTTKENPDSEQSDSESNINPQQENEDIWKDSIATAALTGDYAKDITAIARTQLGVQENKDNFITAEDGTIHCYSRYGQWAGDAYEEWSAAFVNFCVHYANIPQQYLPKSEKVSQWIQQLEAMSLHIEKEGYTPKEGDLVFFLTNEHAEGNSQIQSNVPGHTGIVTGVDEQNLYTIEGNCGGMVQSETYALGSGNIYGYLNMDQVKKLAGLLPADPVDPVEVETPANPDDPDNPDQTEDGDQQNEENPDGEENKDNEEDEKDNEEKQDEESEDEKEDEDKNDSEEFTDGEEQDIDKTSTYGHVLLSTDAVTKPDFVQEKYIKKNDDGTYNITLNVSGSVETQTEKANIDIVFLLDASSSMNDDRKLDSTKNAVNSLVNVLNGKSNDVNTRYKLVTFGTQAEIKTSNWQNGDQIKQKVQNIYIPNNQGTNYDQGLKKTADVLKGDTNNTKKIVIFLTDGKPTYYGSPKSGRGNQTSRSTLDAALTAAEGIKCDQFYGVGIGLEDNIPIYVSDDKRSNSIESKRLSGLDILTSIMNKAEIKGRKEAWNLSDVSQLSDKFKDIASSILTYNFKNVTITDTLSEYVELTDASKLQLKVSKLTDTGYSDVGNIETSLKENTNLINQTVTILEKNYGTVSYDSTSKTAQWSLGEDYGLEENTYYYMQITNVIPSQTAYDQYKENGRYPNVGDDFTDADLGEYRAKSGDFSSNKEGFYSNSSSSVSYKWKDETSTLPYPNPVIQLAGTDLDLKKTDMQSVLLDGAVFKLEQKVEGGTWQTVTGYEAIHVDNADTAIEIKQLFSGEYRLIETEAPKGFQCMKDGIYFKIENNTVILEKQSSGISTGMYALTAASDGQLQILTIKNKKAYNLPSTGGGGTDLFTISGAVFMTGALLLYINKRKEEETA